VFQENKIIISWDIGIKIFVIKMEVAGIGLATVMLCIRMCGIWESSHVRHIWEVIVPNNFDNRLWLRDFRMIKLTFEMLCQKICQVVSSFKIKNIAK